MVDHEKLDLEKVGLCGTAPDDFYGYAMFYRQEPNEGDTFTVDTCTGKPLDMHTTYVITDLEAMRRDHYFCICFTPLNNSSP